MNDILVCVGNIISPNYSSAIWIDNVDSDGRHATFRPFDTKEDAIDFSNQYLDLI